MSDLSGPGQGGPLTLWRHRARILRYFFTPYRWRFILVVGLSLLGGLLEAATLAMLLPLFQSLFGAGESASPQAAALGGLFERIGRIVPSADPFAASCFLLMGLYGLRQAAVLVTEFLIASTTGRVMHDVRKRVYHTYAEAAYPYFVDHKVGELVYNSTIPIKALAIALLAVPRFCVELFRVTAVLCLMAYVNLKLTAALIAITGGIFLPITRLTGRRLYRTGVATRNLNTQFSAQLTEVFIGIKQVLVGNAKEACLGMLDTVNRRFRDAYVRESVLPPIPGRILETLLVLGILGAMAWLRIGAPGSLQGSLPLLGVFGIAVMRTMPSFIMLGTHLLAFANFLPDVERLYAILREGVPKDAQGTRTIASFTQAIAFEQVTFGYPGRPPLFSNLSVKFPRGQRSVITGLSGGGKTSLMNLMLGLYHPTRGRVLVDGVDLRALERASWYRRIGFVSQDFFLFHASVLENIRLFNPAFGHAAVEEAARKSLAHEFIMQLPQGYDTVIGERGMRLSGGQQQRLALARAILLEPDILLLDEATTALDRESERLVEEAIRLVSAGRTVIAIAHRASIIEGADRIYVVENGRLVGDGRHDELLADNAHYQRLQR
jgi:ABC-type multidrug transport system fused ATPase/permease subunit